MKDRVIGTIQMAVKARKTIRGDGLLPSIINGKTRLVVFSSRTGNNSRKKILKKSATAGIPAVELDFLRFNEISDQPASAYGIADDGFAKSILEKLEQEKDAAAAGNAAKQENR